MSAARITVVISEDRVLGRHAFVSRSGEPRAWLEIGEAGEVALYGSPGALRRLAVAAGDAADAADERCAGGEMVGDRGPAAA